MPTFPLPIEPLPARDGAALAREPETRSIAIGVVATIIIHLFLVFFLPDSLHNDFSGVPMTSAAKPTFNIELAPDLLEQPKPAEPLKYVETNPDAPENIPNDTPNFSNRNQQSAQEKATPDAKGDRPAMEGQTKIQSTQLVDGRLVDKVQLSPSAPPVPPAPQVPPGETAAAPRMLQDPFAGTAKIEGLSPDGFATNIAKNPVNPQPVQERVEGVPDAPPLPGTIGVNLPINPQMPQPRQRVLTRARPAVFEENKIGTPNIGIIGRDAKWSAYGEYLNKLAEAVQSRWDNLVSESRTYPNQGSTVTITFVINSNGEITNFKKTEGDAGELAKGWCVAAISPRDGFSYGKWNDSMIALLGNEQELTFSFLYR